jgi:hypothetical protein
LAASLFRRRATTNPRPNKRTAATAATASGIDSAPPELDDESPVAAAWLFPPPPKPRMMTGWAVLVPGVLVDGATENDTCAVDT